MQSGPGWAYRTWFASLRGTRYVAFLPPTELKDLRRNESTHRLSTELNDNGVCSECHGHRLIPKANRLAGARIHALDDVGSPGDQGLCFIAHKRNCTMTGGASSACCQSICPPVV